MKPLSNARRLPLGRSQMWIGVLMLGLSILVLSNRGTTLTMTAVDSIASLRAISNPTTNSLVYVADYYGEKPAGKYRSLRKGGGVFQWVVDSDSITYGEDGGIFIASDTISPTNGLWQRLLQGEIPNVRMWGARGDCVDSNNLGHDDTAAITNALKYVRDHGVGNHLIFPAGDYRVTQPLLIADCLHVEGEGPQQATYVRMTGANILSNDIFRTQSADVVKQGNLTLLGNGTFTNTTTHKVADMAHGLIFENICLAYGTTEDEQKATNQTGAALCLSQAGEAAIIRNIWTYGGGFGVRCLGGGTPGLRVENSSFFNNAIAGVDVEGVTLANGTVLTASGPITLTGVSGDAMSFGQEPTASLVLLSNLWANVSINDLSAEGLYGNGLIRWVLPDDAGVDYSSLKLNGGSLRFGGDANYTAYDVVVLTPVGTNGSYTPTVSMEPFNSVGLRYLIRDELGNRNIAPEVNGNIQMPLRRELQYRSMRSWGTNRITRLTYGDALYQSFTPTTNGWHRVVINQNNGSLTGGRLGIASLTESTEFEFHVDSNTDGYINVLRKSKSTGTSDTSPIITAARAVTYWENNIGGVSGVNGPRAAIELYVDHVPTSTNLYSYPQMKEVHLTMQVEGRQQFGSEATDLMIPQYIVDASAVSSHRTNSLETYWTAPGPVTLLR